MDSARSERDQLEEEVIVRNQRLKEMLGLKAPAASSTDPSAPGLMKFAPSGAGIVTIIDPLHSTAVDSASVFTVGEAPKAMGAAVQAYHGVIFGRQVAGSINCSTSASHTTLGTDCVIVPWRLVE